MRLLFPFEPWWKSAANMNDEMPLTLWASCENHATPAENSSGRWYAEAPPPHARTARPETPYILKEEYDNVVLRANGKPPKNFVEEKRYTEMVAQVECAKKEANDWKKRYEEISRAEERRAIPVKAGNIEHVHAVLEAVSNIDWEQAHNCINPTINHEAEDCPLCQLTDALDVLNDT